MNKIPLQPGLENWKPTHSQHLEKWLGREAIEDASRQMREFYWPVPLSGVPGNVYAMPGGDFAGKILTNGEMSAVERLGESVRRERRALQAMTFKNKIASSIETALERMGHKFNAFASADAVYAAMTGGKAQFIYFAKTGVASNAIGNGIDLWTAATMPVAGAAAGAAAAGTVPTNASTGAIPYVNPASANTGHFIVGEAMGSVINMTLLLYDRLFAVAKTMNSTTAEAVTGVPTRYTSTTSTDLDYCGGNFVFPSVPTTLITAAAHNWTVCTYKNQAAATGTFPLMTGVNACVLRGIDILANTPGWFLPLGAGDIGVQTLTQLQCSALLATGTVDFVIGHPIAIMPLFAANVICIRDGLRGSINLTNIRDSACLALLELPKPATTATTYTGLLTLVSE